MSIALTQVASAASASVAFSSDVTVGATIIVSVGSQGPVPTSVSDTQGNSYTKAIDLQATRGTAIWFATNVVAGATTVTANGITGGHIIVSEWSSTETLEVDDTATDSQTTGTSHPCGEVSNTTISAVAITASRVTNPFTHTVNVDYTELGLSNRLLAQYRILTSTETSDADWTSGAVENVTSCHAVFKESSAAAVTINADETVVPAVVPNPIVLLDKLILPDPTVVPNVVVNPTIGLVLTIQPTPAQTGTGGGLEPEPTITLDRVLFPDPTLTSGVVPNPTVTLDRVLQPDPVVAPLVVPNPTVGLGATLKPDPLVVPLVVPNPTVSLNLTLQPDPVVTTAVAPNATILVDVVVQPDPGVSSGLVPNPTVGLDLTIQPDPVVIPTIVPNLTVTLIVTLQPNPVVITLVEPNPTITVVVESTIQPDPAVATLVLPSPTVDVVLAIFAAEMESVRSEWVSMTSLLVETVAITSVAVERVSITGIERLPGDS